MSRCIYSWKRAGEWRVQGGPIYCPPITAHLDGPQQGMNSSSSLGGGSRCPLLAPLSIAQFCLLYVSTSDEIWQERKLKGSNSAWNWAGTDFQVKHKTKPIKIILGQINWIWPETKCQIWFTANFEYRRIRCASGSLVEACTTWWRLFRVAFTFLHYPTPPQLCLQVAAPFRVREADFIFFPNFPSPSISA